jgi:hypothetical protein
MDITILGYKFNLEILILIGVVYLILVGHTIGGCCNMPLIMEGLESMRDSDETKIKKLKKEIERLRQEQQ